MRVYEENNRLVIADGTLTLWLEPWGEKFLPCAHDQRGTDGCT